MNTALTSTSLTSFSQLFGRSIGGPVIREIEVPLIQRDYAQGRKTGNVTRIREAFINTLCHALLPSTPVVDLDFVFGDVEDKEGDYQGKFYPLDGQQRLTTLFLLHCYLAWQVGVCPQDQSWSKFTYATRAEARDFCEFLVRHKPDYCGTLSEWIKDDADYLPTWQHDPSIQSMLVVLDAIHDWFAKERPDLEKAWAKLVDGEKPAIRFHLLPMKANGLTDALYIKMNSRGKPLTPFENFKAHFEDGLSKDHPEKAKEFSTKVDTVWTDILWPYRGDDHLIDDEFMRYFRFITEVCAWKNGIDFDDSSQIEVLAEHVFGAGAAGAAESLTFLLQAWDAWEGRNVKAEFESIFTRESGGSAIALLMFKSFDKEGVDLFHACCRHYGAARPWSLAFTLLLYGVLLKFICRVPESSFSTRLRILRNLIEASGDEIRAGKERNNMPKLLAEVEQVIVYGNLHEVSTFNQVQTRNELAKSAMLHAVPTLATDMHGLEDHELLRGGLSAFDLDPAQFAQRARTFVTIFDRAAHPGGMPWKLITGALLAKGDYSRKEMRWTGHRLADFGAPRNDEPWQVLFRGRKGDSVHPTALPLAALIADVAAGRTLQTVITTYLDDPTTPKDWRYYFVKYDVMRDGASGRYTFSPSGYQICMLEKERMSSNYYDPYLLAVARQSGVAESSIANAKWPRCFYGYETSKRTLMLSNSELHVESVDRGWQLSEVPTDPARKFVFDQALASFGIGDDCMLYVPQFNGIDTEDRVEMGARLLAKRVDRGF